MGEGGGLQLLKFISPESVIRLGENWRPPEKTNLDFSCTPDREIQCFTLCKKFVILHKLSYTGPTSYYLTLVV